MHGFAASLQIKPNAYGIPIKNECWFLHTNIDSRATPTLTWKGETGNKKQFLEKSEGSAQLILRETKDFGQKKNRNFNPSAEKTQCIRYSH